ncbi:MAG: hypothetical protein RL254_1523, partial [Planctomycetota bacterium]
MFATRLVCIVVALGALSACSSQKDAAAPTATSGAGLAATSATATPAPTPLTDFRTTEASVLTHHVQLTFPDRFSKAGESYFSPDDRTIVFQAIEKPVGDAAPSEFYSMYVADVVRGADGRISAIANIKRISPEGSANTCGWFHPNHP